MKRIKQNNGGGAGVHVPVRVKDDPGAVVVQSTREEIAAITGTSDAIVSGRLISQMADVMSRPKLMQEDAVAGSMAALGEMRPQNATEAMLAVQMVAAHEAALGFLARALSTGQSFEGIDANVLRATRLMRVFNEQLEAMQKLKGKAGQQRMTVEHVHVYEGGQAIVGQVAGRNSGEGEGGGQ